MFAGRGQENGDEFELHQSVVLEKKSTFCASSAVKQGFRSRLEDHVDERDFSVYIHLSHDITERIDQYVDDEALTFFARQKQQQLQ